MDKPHYHGHRERLKERFKKVNYHGFHDYELLELILFLSIQRADVKPVAKDLLQKFHTLENVLHADESLLKNIKGVGPSTIHVLKIMLAVHQRISQMNLQKRNVLSSFLDVLQYCYTHMAFERIEEIRILYLDSKMGLIQDEVHQRGTINRAAFYVQEIIKKALDLGATGMILIHNHPSGNPKPSEADKIMTNVLVSAAAPFDIILHDHIIIGKEGFYSFKKSEDL